MGQWHTIMQRAPVEAKKSYTLTKGNKEKKERKRRKGEKKKKKERKREKYNIIAHYHFKSSCRS